MVILSDSAHKNTKHSFIHHWKAYCAASVRFTPILSEPENSRPTIALCCGTCPIYWCSYLSKQIRRNVHIFEAKTQESAAFSSEVLFLQSLYYPLQVENLKVLLTTKVLGNCLLPNCLKYFNVPSFFLLFFFANMRKKIWNIVDCRHSEKRFKTH